MFSRITGSHQSQKASQEQVSDKVAAGVTALTKLIQVVGKEGDSQVCSATLTYASQLADMPTLAVIGRSSDGRLDLSIQARQTCASAGCHAISSRPRRHLDHDAAHPAGDLASIRLSSRC